MFAGTIAYRLGWLGRGSAILAQAAKPWLAGGFCYGLVVVALEAASVTATLDSNTTTVGESVTLSLVFQGGSPPAAPAVPAPQGLVIQYAGAQSQTTWNNGQLTVSFILSYTVTPQQPGDYLIPATRAQVNGQTVVSQPLRLKVTKASAPPDVSLKLWVPKNEVFLGQVLPAEIQLYYPATCGVRDLQLTPLQAEGFTAGKMANPQSTQLQQNGQVYNVVVCKTSVTPLKVGSLTLGPVELRMNLLVPARNRRRSIDPFDFGMPFGAFDPFGSRAEPRPTALTSNPQTIRVLPLPTQDVPASFNGAVGSYSMTVRAGPTNIAVGDPITIQVQIAGRGAMDTLTLPNWDGGPALKAFPPTSKVESQDPLGLEGIKTFEYVVIPQSPDLKVLPPVTFSFFDPEQKSYRTSQQGSTPLVVRPTAAVTAPPVVAGTPGMERPSAPLPQDIINIKARLGMVTALGPPLIERPWFLALQGLPVLAWLLALGWRKHTERLSRNPRLRRQREVARLVEGGLQELRQHAETNQSEAFYATVFRLLQEQLGERLDLPASAITEAVLDERLRPAGVPEETLARLHEVFQRCNLARYAPGQSSEGLHQFLPEVESALATLKGLKLN